MVSKSKSRTAPTWRNRIIGYDPAVDAATLAAHPKNARIHPDSQRGALVGILDGIGWVAPVMVNRLSGLIVDGHLRVSEAAGRGETVPVVWLELTEAEEAEVLATFDPIAALAEWNKGLLDSLLTAFTARNDDLQAMLDAVSASAVNLALPTIVDDPDAVPDPPAEPTSRPGDVWICRSPAGLEHRVMCGNSTRQLPTLMGAESADCVWTDPPYGVDYVGKTADALKVENDDVDEDALRQLLNEVFSAAVQHCHRGAPWYVAAPAGPMHPIFEAALGELGIHRQTLMWVKQQFVLGHSDYHYRHEPLFYGWVPGAKHVWDADRTQDSVLRFDRPSASREHPTMKPVDLVAHCIRNSTVAGAIVLDPFGGSGTTVIACETLGRHARTMELSPIYTDVICRRWQHATGVEPVLESTGEPHDFTIEASA